MKLNNPFQDGGSILVYKFLGKLRANHCYHYWNSKIGASRDDRWSRDFWLSGVNDPIVLEIQKSQLRVLEKLKNNSRCCQ
jgi:hypothetical protein